MSSKQQDVCYDEKSAVEQENATTEEDLLIRENETDSASLQKLGKVPDAETSTTYEKVKDHARRFVSFYVNNYVLLILTASVGTALNFTSIKILSAKISAMQIAAMRSSFCIPILFIMCYWTNTPLNTYRVEMPFIIIRGVIGAAAFLAQVMATYMLPLGESAFMYNSYPVFTAVLSSMCGMERIGILAWGGVVGCLIGNALVAHPPFLFGGHEEWGQQRFIGILFAIGGAILMSTMFIVLRWMGRRVSSLVLTISANVFIVLFSLPFMFLGYPKTVGLLVNWVYVFPFLMTIVSGTAVMCAMSQAFQIGPPSKVTALFMTNTLIAAAIGIVALSETMSSISIIGAATILLSVLLVQLKDSKKIERNEYQAVAAAEDEEAIELSIQQNV